MKRILITFIFLFSCMFLHAQQDRFVYLQSENKEPFFVKLDNKTYTSSPSGYLIIPKLSQGVYSLTIGFAQSDAVQEFNCSINNRDIGYIIKSNTDSRLQLLNVQSLNVIVPGEVIQKPIIAYEKVSDPFSTMLANAVQDSTILRKDIVQVIAEKIDPPILSDSTKAIVTVTELANNDNKRDSSNDLAKESIVRADTVSLSKDTLFAIVPQPQVAKTENALKTDSVKVELPTEIDAEKSVAISQTDSSTLPVKEVVTTPHVSSLDTITNKTELNSLNNTQVDSVQNIAGALPPNEVAVKTKIKKNKVKTKIESSPNTEAEISKTLDEKPVVQNDPVSSDVKDKEEVIGRIKKKKSKVDNKAIEKEEVEMTVKTTVTDLPSIVNQPANNTENTAVAKGGSIKRRSRKTTKEGVEMTYIDDQVILKDTIKLLIPIDEKNKTVAKSKSKIPDPVFLEDKADITVKPNSNKATKVEEKNVSDKNVPVTRATMVNSDCKSFADASDYFKIRRKMVAEDEELDMVKAARKVFKTKCFTTEQIKNLSVLFLKDEGKFMFFDAAYAFVSDSESFHTLEKQLTEVEYRNRFKAMVKK